MKISEFSVKRKITVAMMTILILILGSVALNKLGLEMMPDIDYPIVSIITIYEGASPEDIEETVTKPLESAIAAVKNIKSLKSESIENQSHIMIEFEWGTNLDFAAQDLRDAMEVILDFLPEDAKRPLVMKVSLSQIPVLIYGVTGMKDTYKLRKILDDEVSAKLKSIDGVASVMLMGGKEAEKQVIINKDKLDNLGISIDNVVKILFAQNQNKPAGHINERQQEYLLRTIGEFSSVKEIENTPIGYSKIGNVIYVKDIAEVKSGFKESRVRVRTNKEDALYMVINKESGANTVHAAEAVKKELEKIKKNLPAELNFHEMMDQSYVVKKVTGDAGMNAVVGGILAIIVMYLFLRNWRPTLAITLAIPISLIATFIPVFLMDYSLNIMTLGGLGLGVGMLVDNAIVVIENIYRHLEKGKQRDKAASDGASEVGMAITASTLTTIAVFFPMVFGGGLAGQLVRGLALTVAFALFTSLFVALTLVPMIASTLFNKKSSLKAAEKRKFFNIVKDKYLIVLNWSLCNRGKTVLIVFVLFMGSLLMIPLIGTEFMPAQDIPMQVLRLKMPVGTKIEETDFVISQVEDVIMSLDDVLAVTVDLGPMDEAMARADPTSPDDVNEATIFFRITDKDQRKISSDEILEYIRVNSPKREGLEINAMDMSTEFMGGGENAPVVIKVFGKEMEVLREINEEITDIISSVPGIRDVNNSEKEGKPEIQIKINRAKAFRYGLTSAEIAYAVRTSTLGTVAGIFREKGDEIDIRVRLEEDSRNSIQEIKNINIINSQGSSIALNQVAEFSNSLGPKKITREHQVRRTLVTANIFQRDLGSTVNDIENVLKDIRDNLPAGYFMQIGGAYADMKDSFKTLIYALILAVVLVYIIMASQFESLTLPFVVMFTVPMAVIGVLAALLLTGTTLSVVSFVGIIMLSGIVVNNGIVLIDHANQLRRKGVELMDSLLQAGGDRIRPVLITAITTIVGMFPLAVSQGQGSEMKSPMAITVIGGLISATFLTLIVIPVLYSITEKISGDIKDRLNYLLHGDES